jgi:hypothetical protein
VLAAPAAPAWLWLWQFVRLLQGCCASCIRKAWLLLPSDLSYTVSDVFVSSLDGGFYLSPTPANASEAETACQSYGSGHLASYTSLAEQQEVEALLIDSGWLLPGFHSAYWLGYQSNASYVSTFVALDSSVKAKSNYTNWGSYMPGNISEPNNLLYPPETCSVANHTQRANGTWRWSDTGCGLRFAYVCRMAGARAARRGPAADPCRPLPCSSFDQRHGNRASPPCCHASNYTICSASPCQPSPCAHLRAAFGLYNYTSTNSIGYVLNTKPMGQAAGQAFCADFGGNLANYVNIEEQREVEDHFIGSNSLSPIVHKHYWLGRVSTAAEWPKFRWGRPGR